MPYPPDNLPPIHPGAFFRDDLQCLGASVRRFAEHIHLPHNAITAIMNGKRAITAQTAHRLARAFETTPQYWLNLQTVYELKKAQADMPEEALGIRPYAVAEEGAAPRSI